MIAIVIARRHPEDADVAIPIELYLMKFLG